MKHFIEYYRSPLKHSLIAEINIYQQIEIIKSINKQYKPVPVWLDVAVAMTIGVTVLLCRFGALGIAIRLWERFSPTTTAFPWDLAGTVGTLLTIVAIPLVYTYIWWIPLMNDRLNRAERDGICLFCGYTLGVPEAERCPECGKSVVRAQQPAAASPSA